MGRPRKEIDASKVEQLASFGASAAEIAAELGVGERTIQRRFGTVLMAGAKKRDLRLRSAMFKFATRGNALLLIFLAKTCLGMREDPTTLINVTQNSGQSAETYDQMRPRLVAASEFAKRWLAENGNGEVS